MNQAKRNSSGVTILSRRSFITTLGQVAVLGPAVSMFSPLVGCRSVSRQICLNVVLHGLFILNIGDTCMELFTPDVDGHIYAAGTWDPQEVQYLSGGNEYSLLGVDYNGSAPQIDQEYNLVLSQSLYSFKIHPDQSLFSVQLPFPGTISFLRVVNFGPNQLPDQQGDAVINTFSLCPTLTYRVSDYRNLRLTGTDWYPRVERETATANLHFWAEPPRKLTPEHAVEAFKSLSLLVSPLSLILGTMSSVPLDRDTGVCGVSTEEEQGWAEWASAGEGSHPTNCNVVVTTR